MSNPLVFDIETAPLPEEQIANLIPPFDPAEVKVGNIKDPALIQEKIKKAEEKHRSDFIQKAALNPDTGRVIAIGFKWAEGWHMVSTSHPSAEKQVIETFWEEYRRASSGEAFREMIGHNIIDFDLPFLIQRSWHLGIAIPPRAFTFSRNGKYLAYAENFIDTRLMFQLGRKEARSSLDAVSRFFGMEGKSETGKEFYLWLEEDPEKAKEYLRKDLDLTWGIAEKMGVIR